MHRASVREVSCGERGVGGQTCKRRQRFLVPLQVIRTHHIAEAILNFEGLWGSSATVFLDLGFLFRKCVCGGAMPKAPPSPP